MDFHSRFAEEPSLISFSTAASEDDSVLDELIQINFSSVDNQCTSEDITEQMNNHIRRLEKRIRYLEKKLVESKKENKRLKHDIQRYQSENDILNHDHERLNEPEPALIGSHAASLRVLHDLITLFDSSKEDMKPSESDLMDLVRSLHYLSLGLENS